MIGIDQYDAWPRLSNAVSDAKGAARLFERLGFEQATAPLLGRDATRDAMHRLVTGKLTQLAPDDSLVLFFAGHGHTQTTSAGDTEVKTGYVIPVDATQHHADSAATWLRLDSWLSDIARLPPRHILVIIDACHSGCALTALHKWREETPWPTTQLDALWARRSRRVITSALEGQRALDSGPYAEHSLFTGCLIEALSGGLSRRGKRVTTGRELGQYVHRRVTTFPGSMQIPDVGAFELDDRGDILIPVLASPLGHSAALSAQLHAASSRPPEVVPALLASTTAAPVLREPRPSGEDETTTHRLPPRSPGGRDMLWSVAGDWQRTPVAAPRARGRVMQVLRTVVDHMSVRGSQPTGWLLLALFLAVVMGVVATLFVYPWMQHERQPRYVAPEPEDTPRSNTSGRSSDASMNNGSAAAKLDADLARPTPAGPRILETEIAVTVPGAMVHVMGTDQSGPAPFTARLEEGKGYKILAVVRGFATSEIDVKAGDPKQTLKMVALPRFVTVSSDPPGAAISIDGTSTGKRTPSEIELTYTQSVQRSVRVGLRKPGFRTVDRTIDFAKFVDGDTRMTAKIDEKLSPAPVAAPVEDVNKPGP